MIEKITAMTICNDGGAIVSENSTVIEITDDGAGEYIQITQPYHDAKDNGIGITKEEWPMIKKAIEKMLKNCKD